MSNERLSDYPTRKDTARSDQNWCDLWGETRSEWTSTIREECVAVSNQPREKGKSRSPRGIVLWSTLAALALLGSAALAILTQAPVASRVRHENVRAIPAE